jgi:hypothetical protein
MRIEIWFYDNYACTRAHPHICMHMYEYTDTQIYIYKHTHTQVMHEILYMSTIINIATVRNFEDICVYNTFNLVGS